MPPFVSTSAVVVDGERVLAVIDPVRHEPILPGGHLLWQEQPRHAVAREVREETGYDIIPGALVAVLAGEEWAGEPGIVRIIYAATVAGGSLVSSGEGEPIWMSIDELATSMSRDAGIVRLWIEQQPGGRRGAP